MDNSKEALYEQLEQLKKANRRLTIANQLTKEFVGETKGVKHLVGLVFERVLETLNAEAGSLWLVDKQGRQNICHLAEGPAKSRILGLRIPEGVGIVGNVIKSGKPEVILDCSTSSAFSKDVDSRTKFVTKSMICVPLIIDDESYGAIQIINKRHGSNGQFDEDDCELVIQLATVASLSVKNARILEMESRVKEMNVLMEISREIVSTLDVDQVLDYIVNKTNELVELDLGAVALWNDKKQALQLMVLSGGQKVEESDSNQSQLLKLMEQIRTIKRSSYVADRQRYKDSLKGAENGWIAYMERNEFHAVWSMPLEDDEGILGVVLFASRHSGFANGSKADLLHILCSQATVALRNASLFKSIPFSAALSKVGQKSFSMTSSGWRKWIGVASLLCITVTSLHYLPIFRWVSGHAVVEARLGQGVFLPISGRMERVLVNEGDQVIKDQPLAVLAADQMQLQLLEAQSQLSMLERQIVQALAEGDAVSMNKAMIERTAIRAKVSQSEYELEQISIRAPIGGVILTPKPDELTGRVFKAGDEILRVVDPANLIMIVHIPEVDLMDVKVGQTVRSVLKSRPGQYLTGQVRHVGRTYEIPNMVLESSVELLEDEQTFTGFIAEVELPELPFAVMPGMTGQALIYTDETSVLVRIWRRIRNFIVFNLGL